ncbi:MAG: Zn-ribbon containing protein, partial [Candidatus Pacearchaeota archaeon]
GEAEQKPVILDLETIRALKPGKFEIDLVKLFKGYPVIFKLEEGKYIIDLASTFQLIKRKQE